MIKHDPVERTTKYIRAMRIIQPILDKEFPADKQCLGMCHMIWRTKKALLKGRYNIDWKSPAEMTPEIHFD